MTYSICVREAYTDDDGTDQRRYGVAVTTRVPSVGMKCPHVSEHAAVCTQAVTNPALGSRGVGYIDEGLAAADALQSLLNADPESYHRQLHGVSADSTFAHTGEDCNPWAGHVVGEDYTVAGNRLAGEVVVDEVSEAYRSGDRSTPLEVRLIDALEAGYAVGGDDRGDHLSIQSAAVRVRRTGADRLHPYSDLRVDATEEPMADLRATYETAREGYDDFVAFHEWEDAQDAA